MNLHAKAHRWANILGYCPGVRAIFLSGSVAEGRATEKSDIDFFIIAKSGQIWTARFFVFLILKLSGQLAKPHHHARKICPNHFIADHKLEIIEQDMYSAHLFAHNVPLYDPDGVYSCFAHANQAWVKAFAIGSEAQARRGEGFDVIDRGAINRTPINIFQKKQSGIFEKLLRKFQSWKIKKNPDYKKKDAVIILTDDELRFHPEPKNRHFSKRQ